MTVPNAQPADEEELTAYLRARLGKELRDDLLERLKETGWLTRYMENRTEQNLKLLVQDAIELNRQPPGRKKGQQTKINLDRNIDEAERRRAEVYSIHLFRHASRREDVLELRQTLFDGSVLGQERTKSFLRQLGPRFFPSEWFKKNEIPILHHGSYYHGPEFGRDEPVAREDQKIRFAWNGQHLDVDDYAAISDDVAHHGVLLDYPGEFPIKVARHSVLGSIQQLASSLSIAYGWVEADAAKFIISGWTPPVFAVGIKPVMKGAYHIAFEFIIEPWVSAESVYYAFAQIQRASCDPMRMRDIKQVELFHHVENYFWNKHKKLFKELSSEELDNPWGKITQLWNEAHGHEQGWKLEPKRLREAFQRGHRDMETPPCGPHKRRTKRES